MSALEKVFHFLDGPAHVLRASTVCRRWHELACCSSVWRVKVEREGILDKAKAFEIDAPPVPEGAWLEDDETSSMAFYARVFTLKVVVLRSLHAASRVHLTTASRTRRCRRRRRRRPRRHRRCRR